MNRMCRILDILLLVLMTILMFILFLLHYDLNKKLDKVSLKLDQWEVIYETQGISIEE